MVAKTNKKKSKAISEQVSPNDKALEKHFGQTLLVGPTAPPQSTTELLKGKKLVGLYFTSSWNRMGKEFTPKLVEFYKKCLGDSDDLEIIYVSSDDDKKSFHETFAEMPWLAMDGDTTGTRIKHSLAMKLKVFRLPTLVVLNTETGVFVTDGARKAVEGLYEITENVSEDGGDMQETLNVEKGKELVQKWKTQEPEELGHSDTFFHSLVLSALHFKENPIYVVVVVVILVFTDMVKYIQKNPLLGMALVYLLLKLGKEPLDKNAPYIEQKGDVPATTSTADTSDAVDPKKELSEKKNE